ncbi:hypothetical protein [Streptomyces sp. SPB074]|uniref:hypothetical protein n=1 Tax=Streptomyces sp. (strain SPB074) TaxID=465543 RepID=UPI0006803731|nr:hypothetical protein [Streptomyces sp. SPB074]
MSTPPPPQHPHGAPYGDPHGVPSGEPPAQPPYPYEQQPDPRDGAAGYGYPAQDPYGQQGPPQPYGQQGHGGYGEQAPYGNPYAQQPPASYGEQPPASYGEQPPASYGEQPPAAPDAYGNWSPEPPAGYGPPQPAPYGTPYGGPQPFAQQAQHQQAQHQQAQHPQAEQPHAAQPHAEQPHAEQPQSSPPQAPAALPPGAVSSGPGPQGSYGAAYDSLYGPAAPPGAAATGTPAFGDPEPAPARGSRRNLFLGIGAGVAVLAVLGAVLLTRGGGGGSDPDAGFPEVHQRLAPPATLLDGAYTRDQDLSRNEGAKINTEARGARDVRDATAVVVTYVGKPGDGGGGSLVVSGFNGRIREPDATRAAMLKGAASAKGAELLAPAKGFGGAKGATKGNTVVSCQTMSTTQGSVTVVFPMCAWADGNTAATIAEITPKSVAAKAADIDLAAAAKRAGQVRAEMTKPYCPGGKGVC